MNRHLQLASYLATLLDSQFGVGKIRFGYGSIINLIPVIGDSIDVILSFYIIWIAYSINVPVMIILRMILNVLVLYLIGLIPFFGDMFYIFRKVNLNNVKLLKKHAPSGAGETGRIISG